MKQTYDSSVVKAIMETRDELEPLLKRLDIDKISKHNRGYMKYAKNPTKYFIDGELRRYIYTVNYIKSNFTKQISILDFGLFIPVVPIALTKIGFTVCAVENLKYYDGALDEIIKLCSTRYNIEVVDLNIFEENINSVSKFDLVLLLAVLEHLNGTPRFLLDRVKSVLRAGGSVIVEVPNAVSLRKRLIFLFKSKVVFSEFEDYYESEYPFSGHNREYTIADLQYALERSGFSIYKLATLHPTVIRNADFKTALLQVIEMAGPASWKPDIWAIAKIK